MWNVYLKPRNIYIEGIKEIEVYTFETTQKFNGSLLGIINDFDSIDTFENALKKSQTKVKFKDYIDANAITESYSLKVKAKNSEGGFLLFLFIGQNNEESCIIFLGYEDIYHIPSEETEKLKEIFSKIN